MWKILQNDAFSLRRTSEVRSRSKISSSYYQYLLIKKEVKFVIHRIQKIDSFRSQTELNVNKQPWAAIIWYVDSCCTRLKLFPLDKFSGWFKKWLLNIYTKCLYVAVFHLWASISKLFLNFEPILCTFQSQMFFLHK